MVAYRDVGTGAISMDIVERGFIVVAMTGFFVLVATAGLLAMAS